MSDEAFSKIFMLLPRKMVLHHGGNSVARTLILAQGLELERLWAAVNKHRADKIIIIRNTHDLTDNLREIIEKLVECFENDLKLLPGIVEVDSKTYRTNFFSLPEATSLVHSVIQKEMKMGNEVTVDISSGTKIMALALFLAGQFNAVPISYCIASRYFVEDIPAVIPQRAQIAKSSEKSYDVPRLPMQLNPVSFAILEQLANAPARTVSSVKQLASRVYQKSEDEVTRGERGVITGELKKLEYYKYIYIERFGVPRKREVAIKLTHDGEKVIPLKTLFEKQS